MTQNELILAYLIVKVLFIRSSGFTGSGRISLLKMQGKYQGNFQNDFLLLKNPFLTTSVFIQNHKCSGNLVKFRTPYFQYAF